MNSSVYWLKATARFSYNEERNRNGEKFPSFSSSPSQPEFPAVEVPEMPSTNTTMVVILIAILFASLVINLVVLYSVTSLPKRKLGRPATILVAHLSSIAVLFAGLGMTMLSERISLWQLRGQGACELISFFKSTILGIFSLNIIAIIYERFRVFNCFNRGKLLIYRLILLIWVIAIVASIPNMFMVTYQEYQISGIPNNNRSDSMGNGMKKGMCKSIPLFGIFEATVIYELMRFILFHVSVVCYMAYAMYKIRANLAHLHFLKPTPNVQMRKKVKTIRFIYIHFAVFILVWLPIGALTFAFRVMNRRRSGSRGISTVGAFLGLLLYLYLVLNPLIYLCLDVGCCFCIKRKKGDQKAYHPRDKSEGEITDSCQNNVEIDSGHVNGSICKPSYERGGAMRKSASASCRKNKTLSGSYKNGEVKVNKQKVRRSCDSQVELQSLDMSRVSTYAVTPSSSIDNL